MEMSNPISVGGLILMGIKSASLTSLVGISFLFLLLCWVIELYDDFYSTIIHPTLHFFYVTWKCVVTKNTNHPKVKNIILNSRAGDDNYDYGDCRWILREEVELVMERLGLYCNSNCEKLKERYSSNEIANMFNVNEPMVGEVKQAFDLFDENSDGYIDDMELNRVLKRLGFRQFSGKECQRMITVYDYNGDGLIDFSEFCQLVEDSFC